MDYSELIAKYVNGKIHQRFEALAECLAIFLKTVQPQIEDVNRGVRLFQNKSVSQINAGKYRDIMRASTEGAMRCLQLYKRTFGTVNYHLAMMSSNFGLPQFLDENGVSRSEMAEFQSSLAEYWTITYADLISFWSAIEKKLVVIQQQLTVQVKMMERLPSISYFEGFDEADKLRKLFAEEYKTFYEIMSLTQQAVSNVSRSYARINTAINREKAKLYGVAKELKTDFRADVKNAKGRAQKSVVVVIYLVGAIKSIYAFKNTMKNALITRVVKSVFLKVISGIAKGDPAGTYSAHFTAIQDDISGIMADKVPDAGQLASNITAVCRALS